ncbi:hypothetical protein MMC25_007444, partial [Agyrium rufum]|nr:hypothetical protein [Agyrium rufum]
FTLYQHASGFQTLDPDALSISPDSTYALGSAGKFITHIAALQCVERGLISLDEPVYTHLPELKTLDILSKNEGSDASARPFLLRPPTKKITLRHLLNHSSGICLESERLVTEWRRSTGQTEPIADYQPTASLLSDNFTTPLLFEPGEGWLYGANIGWLSAFVSRLTNQRLDEYIQENIFDPLGIKSTTYKPQDRPELAAKALQMVWRQDNRPLQAAKYPLQELISSVSDLSSLLADLISPSSKILNRTSQDLLFAPQFAPSSLALSAIRSDTENYAAPAGIPSDMKVAPVNHTLAALLVEERLPLSHMPAGTVTWNGMPNFIWAMHREKRLAMVFATQLLPVDDKKTVDVAMAFFRGVWDKYLNSQVGSMRDFAPLNT